MADQTRVVNQLRGSSRRGDDCRRAEAAGGGCAGVGGRSLPAGAGALARARRGWPRCGADQRGRRRRRTARGRGRCASGCTAAGSGDRRGLVDEGLVWRGFTNRRQIGGLLGFADALQQRRGRARPRDQRRRQSPVASREHSTRVELGPLATGESLTRWYCAGLGRANASPHRDRRAGAETADRIVAYARTGCCPRGVLGDGVTGLRG